MDRGERRRLVSATAAVLTVASASLFAARMHSPAPRDRPNVVVILTDDQTFESLPHDPPVMPYLQGQIQDPNGNWISFPNTFANTPLCCPSRATILTGRFSHHTGVRTNGEGARLDTSSTLATWLHDAGYTTGLVGKYLNLYPFDRAAPSIPPGWDTWFAKTNQNDATVYQNYTVIDGGFPVHYDARPQDYATDVLETRAVEFIRQAAQGRPFFLLFTPSAPHRPWTPPPRHADAFVDLRLSPSPAIGERDVSDKPAWVRDLPPLGPGQLAEDMQDRRQEYATLLGVDDAVRRIDGALRARDALNDTVVVFMTDNGYALGEHRWETKACPYEPCIRTPMFVRVPGAIGRTDPRLVSNVDVAPTIASLAHVIPATTVDGEDLAPSLLDPSAGTHRDGVLLEWVGGGEAPSGGGPSVPGWWGVRTKRWLWVEYVTGERELYDLRRDPNELHNLAQDPSSERERVRMRELLATLRGQ
jgi:N-acetylglucosamine-6-sulfatase